ncbi:hypothetical protein Tco_1196927 [Tanacetum coccineum]
MEPKSLDAYPALILEGLGPRSINLNAAVFVAVSILKAFKTEDLSRKLEVNYVKFQFRGGLLGLRPTDLTGSSPLIQTGMVDFGPGRAVTEASQRKRVKYEAKCADIRYGFLPFSFSSFGELGKDAMTLLKRIRKFSMAQDIEARAAVHIFNKIGFSIAKGVGAQIVYRLLSNFL